MFLTVYNPGPKRTVSLVITRNGAPARAMAYPGATPSGDGWTIEMPENSVWFGTIDETTWDGAAVDVTWTATMSDAAGIIGVPGIARYIAETP